MTVTPERAKTLIRKAIERQDEPILKETIGMLLQDYDLDTVIAWVYDDVLHQVDGESAMWCYRLMLGKADMDALNAEATTFMVQSLTEKGYQMGTDFSFNSEGRLITTLEVTNALINDVPEKQRGYFHAKIQKVDADDSQALLEKHLGVPFVDNLVRVVIKRMPQLDDIEFGVYLLTIIFGVETKTKIDLFEILITELKKVYPERIGTFLDNAKNKRDWDFDVPNHCAIDLVRAAGGEGELKPDLDDPNNFMVSRNGLALLAQVYEGENSVYDVIAEMDAEAARRSK